MSRLIILITLFMLTSTTVARTQDTLQFDTIIRHNGYRTVFHFDGYWIIKPDTLFNVVGDYKLKVPLINLGEDNPNTYYYRSYSKVIKVKRTGNSMIVMDRYSRTTTIYRKYGMLKYLYFSF